MKATVYYKDFCTGRKRQKTIEVEHNEPCHIVEKFLKETEVCIRTYISHIKCGRYDYQWDGVAKEYF